MNTCPFFVISYIQGKHGKIESWNWILISKASFHCSESKKAKVLFVSELRAWGRSIVTSPLTRKDEISLKSHQSRGYHHLVLGSAVLALTAVGNGLAALVAGLAVLQVVDRLSRNTDLLGSRGGLVADRGGGLGELTHDRGGGQSKPAQC